MKKLATSLLGISVGLFLYSSALADKICVAGNFDGDYSKAKQIVNFCKDQKADAILLMGDYGVRGISGKVNYKTDFNSTKNVLNEFGKTNIPVFLLSGSNDKISDIMKISNHYKNMHALKDNIKTKIADMNVISLNGYNNKRFMFEGAKFINENEFNKYLKYLSKNSNSVAVSHIAPYGDVDVVPNLGSVGEKQLERVLKENDIDSISNAIRESPNSKKIGKRWKINPSIFPVIINTNGKGKIKRVDFYRIRK